MARRRVISYIPPMDPEIGGNECTVLEAFEDLAAVALVVVNV
jgi:hypothetical protein